jgi:hypothetical protein
VGGDASYGGSGGDASPTSPMVDPRLIYSDTKDFIDQLNVSRALLYSKFRHSIGSFALGPENLAYYTLLRCRELQCLLSHSFIFFVDLVLTKMALVLGSLLAKRMSIDMLINWLKSEDSKVCPFS